MPSPTTRNQSLDVLRALAVFLTMGRHLPDSALLYRAGWTGVVLFFVLSGYLISGLLFNEYKTTGGIKIGRFLLRRGFKIWPPFYALILGTIGFLAIFRFRVSWAGVSLNSIFVQNYFFNDHRCASLPLFHAWSLAVEEHFYILLPVFFVVLIRVTKGQPFRWLPAMLIALLVLTTYLRWNPAMNSESPFTETHVNLHGLFAGVTLGYLQHFREELFRKISSWPAAVIAIVFCLPAFFWDLGSLWFQTVGFTVLIIGFAFLVAWAVPRNPSALLGTRVAGVLAKIGGYSYSIYLWHVLVTKFFSLTQPSAFRFCSYVLLCCAYGIVMAELIERPFLALREKLMSPKIKSPAIPKEDEARRVSASELLWRRY